jgi:hypothetical protein
MSCKCMERLNTGDAIHYTALILSHCRLCNTLDARPCLLLLSVTQNMAYMTFRTPGSEIQDMYPLLEVAFSTEDTSSTA